MSDNLSSLNSSGQLKFHLSASRVAKSIEANVVSSRLTIRSSQNLTIFYSKISKTLRSSGSQMPGSLPGAKTPSVLLEDAGRSSQRGVTRRYPKQFSIDWIGGRVAKYSEAYPVDPKGKPQLNGFVSDIKGTFEPHSFRLCAAVNEAKLMLQYQGFTPHPNPASIRKIDKQTILTGFGGGREGVCQVNKKDTQHTA